MKSLVKKVADKFAQRVVAHVPVLRRKPGHFSHDILEVAHLRASFQTASYYEQHLRSVKSFNEDEDLLRHAVSITTDEGLFLEFGVASGRTINMIGAAHPGPVFGFDSFEGLPEDWSTEYLKGAFAQALPKVLPNVTLIKGWFSETLPVFLATKPESRVAFMHVDCDLYSSTVSILANLGDRIQTGTVIVFDEYWNYPGWRLDEFKAFKEFVQDRGLKYRYEGFVRSNQQVCVVIE